LVVALALLLLAPVGVGRAAPPVADDGVRLLGADGSPAFLLGVNYEGPSDRAWQMWDDGQFDAGLIDADFQRAATMGARVVRVFVQRGLARDVGAGRWGKLDQVLAAADRHHLALVVSLQDYADRDLQRVAAVDQQIAQHLRGRAGVYGYDLKNEPRFGDLALARYPSPPPLQQRGLIDLYGERLPRDQVADFRAGEEGAQLVAPGLSDDDAYVYVNNLRLYRAFLADASAWVRERGGRATTLDYMDDPAGQAWAPLLAAMDQTLQAWLAPQVAAVRGADPDRPITVEHTDAVMAKLPANDVLDYQTLHRYPGTSAAALAALFGLVDKERAAHPGKPFVLGEFGYATDTLDARQAAVDETAVELGLLAHRAAGGSKWMLTDLPDGVNERERRLGAFDQRGAAKPVVAALAALRTYLDTSTAGPGTLALDQADGALRYVYTAGDAVLVGGKQVDARGLHLSASEPRQVFVTWSQPGQVKVWASDAVQLTIDLGRLMGGPAGGQRSVTLGRAGWSALAP
jgi:hypothetical protein